MTIKQIRIKAFLSFSSTTKKKSYHFIHGNPSVMFENVKTLGVYIKSIFHNLLYAVATHTCSSFKPPNISESFSLRGALESLSPYIHTLRNNCSNCLILNDTISVADFTHLIVHNRKNEYMLSIDLNVYSKNQQFRLYDSTKHGQDNPLILTNDYPFDQLHSHSYFDILRKSLITNINDTNLPLITLDNGRFYLKQSSMLRHSSRCTMIKNRM